MIGVCRKKQDKVCFYCCPHKLKEEKQLEFKTTSRHDRKVKSIPEGRLPGFCSILNAMLVRFAGMYAAGPYALAQGDVEAPYLILQSFIYSVITYWMIR